MKLLLFCEIVTAMSLVAPGNCASQDMHTPAGLHRNKIQSKTADAFSRRKAADLADHILTVGEIRTSELHKAAILALDEIRSGEKPSINDATRVEDNVLRSARLIVESILKKESGDISKLGLKYVSIDVYIPFPSINVREQQTAAASISIHPFKGFRINEVICVQSGARNNTEQDIASNETRLLDPDDYLSTMEHVVYSRPCAWDVERFRDKAFEDAVDEFCTAKPISAQITIVAFDQSDPNVRAVKSQDVSLTVKNGKWQAVSFVKRSSE